MVPHTGGKWDEQMKSEPTGVREFVFVVVFFACE